MNQACYVTYSTIDYMGQVTKDDYMGQVTKDEVACEPGMLCDLFYN